MTHRLSSGAQAYRASAVGPPFAMVTSATRLTPLSASARLPSRVTFMLRTTPPPAGMIHVWNFSVRGSKRTSVLGRTPDSLYHTAPPVVAMPYGCDCAPPGDAHSLTAPVAGSNRP